MVKQLPQPRKNAPKNRELAVEAALTAAGIQFERQVHHVWDPVGGYRYTSQKTKYCYVDFVIKKDNFDILLECDEKEHSNRKFWQERTRERALAKTWRDAKKIVIIRFNPDAYTIGSRVVDGDLEDRLKTLCARIKAMTAPAGRWARLQMYYSREEGAAVPLAAEHWLPGWAEITEVV